MTSSPNESIEQRIAGAVMRALKIADPGSSTPLRMGSTPGWDSMGHMMVVMELEKEFNTRFPPYLLPQLVDVEAIAKTLRKPA
ncbi:MAG: acyl carrier protein [Acidobacteriia bacterium]|nr:acyl carrier protein [Terriglobia bacterium]